MKKVSNTYSTYQYICGKQKKIQFQHIGETPFHQIGI